MRAKSRWRIGILVALNAFLLLPAAYLTQKNPDWWHWPLSRLGFDFTRRVTIHNAVTSRIVEAAKTQQGTIYSAAYMNISYPNGDVPLNKGACSDVVVRALRGADYDLQKLIHEDISQNWKAYPNHWGLAKPDANIDHRRVPNQMIFFARHGLKLPNETSARTRQTWQPGDIVCWKTGPHRWHTGVLSDGLNAQNWPLVVHNGSLCVEADCLKRWSIIGHFRFPKAQN